MVSRRTRVVSWIFRRDHPSRPKAMICCFFSSFKTFAMLREATDPPAAVNVLDVSSESMAAFQVFTYGRFWVFTEDVLFCLSRGIAAHARISCGGRDVVREGFRFSTIGKRELFYFRAQNAMDAPVVPHVASLNLPLTIPFRSVHESLLSPPERASFALTTTW